MFEVVMLLIAGGSTWLHPIRVPAYVGPTACAGVVLVFGSVALDDAVSAVQDLGSPLLFLAFAVPLAVALDDLGVFAALAARFGSGRHLVAALWILAAGVVVVFNLDAAVVLLTPLYIQSQGDRDSTSRPLPSNQHCSPVSPRACCPSRT